MNTLGVRLESNGLYWVAAWTAGNKRRRKSLGAKATLKKREALGLCRELAAEHLIRPGAKDKGKAPSLAQWLATFMDQTKANADTTRSLHEFTGRLLRCHFDGVSPDLQRKQEADGTEPAKSTRLDRITRGHAAEFRVFVEGHKTAKGEPISEATVVSHMTRARQIFELAKSQDLIPFNPFDREACTTPVMEHDWFYVDMATLDKILESCPRIAWRCVFGLARLAGLRRGEIQRLKLEDIDWQTRVVRIRTKPRNGKRKKTPKSRLRTTPLCEKLYRLLMEAQELAEPGQVLVCPIGPNNIERRAKAIVDKAGVQAYTKPLHTLRKNLVTDWQAKFPPLDVAAWLGHDIMVAASNYHQTLPETLAKVTGGSSLSAVDSDKSEKQALEARIKELEHLLGVKS